MNNKNKSLFFTRCVVILTITAQAALAAPTIAPARATLSPGTTDRLVVKLRKGTLETPLLTQHLGQAAGVQLHLIRHTATGALVYQLPAPRPLAVVRRTAARIMRQPAVLYAHADPKIPRSPLPLAIKTSVALRPQTLATRAINAPNDPLFSRQWYLQAYPGLNAVGAWSYTTGDAALVVAVVDTGVNPNHPDLSGRMIAGYNFVDESMDPSADPASRMPFHGDSVSSLIGAATNNNQGMAGMNWNSMLLEIRTVDDNGSYESDNADAFYWAAGLPFANLPPNPTPARVINYSQSLWGAHMQCSQNTQDVLDAVRSAGVVVVVAAGNDGKDAAQDFPANCDGPIVVGATDAAGNRASFSNWGATVTVAAPGTRTITAGLDGYIAASGTSQAAALVSGVVSLMLSANPSLSPDDVQRILVESSWGFPADANCDGLCHTGIVDAARAVRGAMGLPYDAPAPVTPQPPPSTSLPSPSPSRPALPSQPPQVKQPAPPVQPPRPAPTMPGTSLGGIFGGGPGTLLNTPTLPSQPTQAPKPAPQPRPTPVARQAPKPAPAPLRRPQPLPRPGYKRPPATNYAVPGRPSPVQKGLPRPIPGHHGQQGTAHGPRPAPANGSRLRVYAGGNLRVQPGAKVILHGNAWSQAPDRVAGYTWQQVAGPVVRLSNPHAAQPAFIAPRLFSRVAFRLTAVDTAGHRGTALVNVLVVAPHLAKQK